MIRLLILLLLTSPSIFAQQTRKQEKNPTLKESVEELKQSAKAIGGLFKKKKQKETRDSTNTEASGSSEPIQTVTPKILTATSEGDSMIDKNIGVMLQKYLTDAHKADKPKLSVQNDPLYMEFQFDFGEGIRSSYYFSKYKNENVTGDLNADQIDDLVLKVSSYTGGNTEYLDLFVFIREGNDWILKSKIESSDTKLKGCEIGQFIPQKIENNLLIGESLCFTEDDPRCCPSIKRIRKLKWSNNTFVAVK